MSSGTNDFLSLDGGDFIPSAPNALANRVGGFAELLPNWTGTSGSLSYCTYEVILPTYPSSSTMSLVWDAANHPLSANTFIGFSNWNKNMWEWFQGDVDGVVTLPGWDDYKDANGRMLVLVALTGQSRGLLKLVNLGEDEQRGTGLDGTIPPDGTTAPPLYVPPLPPAVDLSPGCAPINDQLLWGSCTAFAFADGVYNYILNDIYGRLGWDLGDDAFKASPKFLYISSGERFGWPPSGDFGRYMDQLGPSLELDGVSTEVNSPYDMIYNSNWGAAAQADSNILRIDSYSQVLSSGDAGRQTIKGLLANAARPVAVGMQLDESFPYYTPGSVYNYMGPPIGGHAMCIVGYDDAKQAYKVRNSWSTSWGENGYVWISYATFDNPNAYAQCFVIDDSYDPAVVSRFLPFGDDLVPPSNVQASDGTTDNAVDLSWSAVPGATGYKVYRDTKNNLLASIGDLQTYSDPTALPGSSYIYWVTATDSLTESALSNSDIGYASTGSGIVDVTPHGGAPNQSVTFSASVFGGADNYSWDFGGGATPNTSTDSQPQVTLGAEGEYDASLTVSNSNGQDTFVFTLSVGAGLSPHAWLGANPTNGFSPLTVDFSAASSYDPDGSIVLYEWDWDADGTWDEQTTLPYASHTFSGSGFFYPLLQVTDNSGQTGQTNETIRVTIEGAPYARIEANPVSGPPPLDVEFTISNSYDDDGTITLYELDFENDGTYDYSQADATPVHHIYTEDGHYVCRLRVTDNDGKTETETDDVIVGLGDMPPGWVGYSITTFLNLGTPFTQLFAVDGKPAAVVQNSNSPYEFQYIQANVPEPAVAADWTVTDIPQALRGYSLEFMANGTEPVMVTRPETDPILVYARYDGTNWVSHTADELVNWQVGDTCNVAMIGGRPAVAYEIYYSGVNHLGYARSNVTNPTQTSDWVVMEIPLAEDMNGVMDLYESGGVPIIAFGRRESGLTGLGIAYASQVYPNTGADWANYEALPDYANDVRLDFINGLPAMVLSEAGGVNKTYVLHSSVDVPQSASDWDMYTLDPNDPYSGGQVDLFGGFPCFTANRGAGGIFMFQALNADPQGFADWQKTMLFPNWYTALLDSAVMPFGRPALLARRDQQHSIYYMYKLP